MNYNDISNLIIKGENIHNIPLRVCYYARVSTDSELQLNSLNNQKEYYENYIKSNNNWTYITGYIDEGVTGVNTDKRIMFKKMIDDAKNNKFDLIITKEVSRFARDLEDSIHYIRELKTSNVGVFFENQNLNTFDSNSELILNIMFNLAQEESKKLSSRIKFGHNQAIKNGHVLGSSNITGYIKDNCKLKIVPEEARFIKTVFELYATGDYGFYKLSKELAKLGYLNKNKKLYDKDSLKRIIINPKYKGYYRAKTYETIDYRTKKRKKNNIKDQIIYKCEDNKIPAIIKEELWNKANSILESRSKNYKNNNYWSGGIKFPLSSKIYCEEHSTTYQRISNKKKGNIPKWCCNLYVKHGLQGCNSPIILEKDLYNILSSIVDKLIPNNEILINDMQKLYKEIDINNEYIKEINKTNNDLKVIEQKQIVLIDLICSGEINKKILNNQLKHYKEEINELNKRKIKLNNLINVNNKLNIINNKIFEELKENILKDTIKNIINKILITKIDNNRNDLNLDIYLNFYDNKISSNLKNSKLYLNNQTYKSKDNKYRYNVYILSKW